jgi:hypothetical protein
MIPICFDVMKPSPTPLVRYFTTVCNMKRIDLNPCQHSTKMEHANLTKKLHSTHGASILPGKLYDKLNTDQTTHQRNFHWTRVKSCSILKLAIIFAAKANNAWQNGWTTNFKLTLRVSHHLGFGTTSHLHNFTFVWLELSNKQLADRKDRITLNII